MQIRFIIPLLFVIMTMVAVDPLAARAQPGDQSMVSPVLPVKQPILEDKEFDWQPAIAQSMRFLMLEHGFRLAVQPFTRSRLKGPFFSDWMRSVKATRGWGDSDAWPINYVLHPMQGAATGFIQIQNDPKGRKLEFRNTPEYWRSRLKALAWNAAYSVQFEVGPLSEASLGNVGQRKGTSGYVDHVMTPAGGFALTIAEDALDRYVIKRFESRTPSLKKRGIYRVALNPCRSFANILRGKSPWHRDTRPFTD